jgi:hypothetical protein
MPMRTRKLEARKTEAISRMPLGAGACPLDREDVEEFGDIESWDEIDVAVAAEVGAV